ncbi:MAG TPA: NAD(P)H-binding protein, partial [Candidatus Kapabacteria bacterium]
MQILITGATGMVGGEVVRAAIADPEVDSVVAVSRRPLEGIEHPKLRVWLLENFLDFSSVSEAFQTSNVCIWCLGTSQNKVNAEEYARITYDYTLAGARAMLGANPAIRMVFVSGKGADPTMKSRLLFARVKGKTEVALRELPFQELIVARPAGIQPVRPNPSAACQERMVYPFYP